MRLIFYTILYIIIISATSAYTEFTPSTGAIIFGWFIGSTLILFRVGERK